MTFQLDFSELTDSSPGTVLQDLAAYGHPRGETARTVNPQPHPRPAEPESAFEREFAGAACRCKGGGHWFSAEGQTTSVFQFCDTAEQKMNGGSCPSLGIRGLGENSKN